MSEPLIEDPNLPAGYVPERSGRHLAWKTATSWLEDSKHYWLSTTRPDGSPHVVPRWGVWVDGRFWYDGSPDTRHARNLAHNPACALHLESGEQVLVLEGSSGPSGPVPVDVGKILAAEYARKYAPTYTPAADSWSGDDGGGMAVFVPKKGFAWSSFPDDVTRYRWP